LVSTAGVFVTWSIVVGVTRVEVEVATPVLAIGTTVLGVVEIGTVVELLPAPYFSPLDPLIVVPNRKKRLV